MNRTFAPIILVCAALFAAPPAASAISISLVPIGNAGNAADPATEYGAVAYTYSIGEYDVTDAQYAAFLSAKAAASDTYGLWNSAMDPNVNPSFGGIARSGSGPYTYSLAAGFANIPVAGVSWYDAVRFVNWLQNGQGNGDTETGTYTITGGGNNSGTVTIPTAAARAAWALAGQFHWVLPSENEWYKAAYYDAANSSYFAYPFQSNSLPAGVVPPGNSNSGNFSNDGFLTNVGAYTNSFSPFGAFDMGGDVWQWDEAQIGSSRGLRGASWFDAPSGSAATIRGSADPTGAFLNVGFRVASVPEPSSIALIVMGAIGAWIVSHFQFRSV